MKTRYQSPNRWDLHYSPPGVNYRGTETDERITVYMDRDSLRGLAAVIRASDDAHPLADAIGALEWDLRP